MALTDPQAGQLLALASAASFALGNNCISRTGSSGGDKGVMFSVLVTMLISLALWLGQGAAATGVGPGDAPALGWFALAGLLAMVFGRSLVFESIRRLGVTRATAVKRLNPFFAVILAGLFLGESLGRADLAGIAAIALGFALLVRDSFRRRGRLRVAAPPPSSYLFGVAGALAYAGAYVTRKFGLGLMPEPAFGTFVSALAGFAVFALLALVSPRYRSHFRGIFAHLDRWILASAVMVSFGQILLFAALAYEKVSTVVMIASTEIFLSIFLSVVVFRAEARPGPSILLAAGLVMAGVLLVAAN